MHKHLYPLLRSRDLFIDRRSFLIASAMSAAGLSLYPWISVAYSPVFNAVEKLKNAVNAIIINSKIDDYININSNNMSAHIAKVKEANNFLKGKEFKDFSGSTVYALQPDNAYFFYPVKTNDGSNTALVFFDTTRPTDSQQVAIIAGPTLFGIGEAAEGDPTGARATLLPKGKASFCSCPINASYTEPDVYTTAEGTVSTNYQINNGRREVTVQVRSSSGRDTTHVYELPQA